MARSRSSYYEEDGEAALGAPEPMDSGELADSVKQRRFRWRKHWRALVLAPVLLLAIVGFEVVYVATAPSVPGRPPSVISTGAAAPEAPHMVWLGDATVVGLGAQDVENTLPRLVAQDMSEEVEVTVLARGGARLAEVIEDQLPAVEALEPDVVFVSVGLNDATQGTMASPFADNYATLLDGLPPTAQVVTLGVPDLSASTRYKQPLKALASYRTSRLDAEVQKAAKAHDAAYVDLAGHSTAAFASDPGQYLAVDGIHPSDAGYRLWADAVSAAFVTPEAATGK